MSDGTPFQPDGPATAELLRGLKSYLVLGPEMIYVRDRGRQHIHQDLKHVLMMDQENLIELDLYCFFRKRHSFHSFCLEHLRNVKKNNLSTIQKPEKQKIAIS